MTFKIRAAWKVENIRSVRTIVCVRLREQDLNNDFGREFTSRNVSGNIVKFWVGHVRWDPYHAVHVADVNYICVKLYHHARRYRHIHILYDRSDLGY